jgi:hypothetical protein
MAYGTYVFTVVSKNGAWYEREPRETLVGGFNKADAGAKLRRVLQANKSAPGVRYSVVFTREAEAWEQPDPHLA